MSSINENVIAKLELREESLKKCRELSVPFMRDAKVKISEDVLDIINRLPRVNCVAIYNAINHEVDMTFLAEMLASKGIKVALPRVIQRAEPLVFNEWDLRPLHDKDVTGIPCSMGREIVPDVVIVPLVAFSKEGYRLGYGGGYFDRTFAKLGDDVHRIGIGYELQLTDAFEADEHDVPMHAIVTENQVRKF